MKKIFLTMMAAVLLCSVMSAQGNMQQGKVIGGNVLGLYFPVWEKFANGKGVTIFKSADEKSPKLKSITYDDGKEWKSVYIWDNDSFFKSGKKYEEDLTSIASECDVFPIIEENEDWVKILITKANDGILEAYMRKSDCKIVSPAPITQEILDFISHRMYRKDYIIPDGKLKSLCFTTRLAQHDDTYLTMGVIDHGRIIYNWNAVLLNGSKKNTAVKILFDRNEDEYTLYYTAKNTARTNDYKEPGYTGIDLSMIMFDAKTLTELQLTNLYNTFCKEKIEAEYVAYYFPDLSKEFLYEMHLKNAALLKDIPAMTQTITGSGEEAQQVNVNNNEVVYETVDQMPAFLGGASGLINFLSQNVHYPDLARVNNIQGRVIVRFIVEKDGSTNDCKIVNSVDPLLDKEAIRVVKSMPKWQPGMKDGKPVRVSYTIPISFKL